MRKISCQIEDNCSVDRATIIDVDVDGVGAMDVSVKRSAAEFCANVIARSVDRATTIDVDVNGVGAMDVSVKRSAAEFCANVIARSVDRAVSE